MIQKKKNTVIRSLNNKIFLHEWIKILIEICNSNIQI